MAHINFPFCWRVNSETEKDKSDSKMSRKGHRIWTHANTNTIPLNKTVDGNCFFFLSLIRFFLVQYSPWNTTLCAYMDVLRFSKLKFNWIIWTKVIIIICAFAGLCSGLAVDAWSLANRLKKNNNSLAIKISSVISKCGARGIKCDRKHRNWRREKQIGARSLKMIKYPKWSKC